MTTTKTRRIIEGITHGRNASYILGCRCDLDTAAHNTYEKERNALRRAKRVELREKAARGLATVTPRSGSGKAPSMVVVVCVACGRRGRANSKLVEATGRRIEKCDECRGRE